MAADSRWAVKLLLSSQRKVQQVRSLRITISITIFVEHLLLFQPTASNGRETRGIENASPSGGGQQRSFLEASCTDHSAIRSLPMP